MGHRPMESAPMTACVHRRFVGGGWMDLTDTARQSLCGRRPRNSQRQRLPSSNELLVGAPPSTDGRLVGRVQLVTDDQRPLLSGCSDAVGLLLSSIACSLSLIAETGRQTTTHRQQLYGPSRSSPVNRAMSTAG